MKAWQLLDSREKWCQGYYAKDKNGHPIEPTSRNAACWCIEGALMKCQGNGFVPFKAYDMMGACTAIYNDNPQRTWEEVHALLKELDI